MLEKIIQRIIGALVILLLLAPLFLVQPSAVAHPPLQSTAVPPELRNPKFLKDPCTKDPNNPVNNGSMGPERGTQYGTVADGWDAFVIEGTAQFRWVDNEQAIGDTGGSVQIYSGSTFDAGLYQTVRGLQPGTFYWFRLGYSLAAKSYSGPNVRVSSIGRKVGVDPFGGTDPRSPNVIWGPDFFDGNGALNLREMVMLFAARSPNATIFLRAMARDGSSGENRVWFDAVCMEARNDMPTATPAVPTATSVPPTATVRPTNTRPPATRVAQAPPTDAPPTAAPTNTPAPTPTETPPPSATPRFARPVPTVAPEAGIDLGAGAVIGVVSVLMIGAFVFFGIGIVWWRRMS